MKGVKCIKLLICFTILALSFVLFSNDTKAVDYQSSIPYNVSSAALIFNNGGTINFTNDSTGGAYAALSGINNTSGLNYLAIRFSGTITARSIVTFIVKTSAPIGTYPQVGWTARSAAYSVLDVTYGEYGTTFVSLFVDQSLTGEFDLTATNFPVTATSLDVHVSAISTTSLRQLPSYNQLQDIKTTLSSMLADLDVTNANVNNLNTNVTNILREIRNMASDTERTADAVEEQNEKDDEDRSNLESQSSDTDDAASSSSEDAESTGTTLLGAFSAFVTALTSASPSNCNIDMDLGNLDLGVVNLCQLSPPQPIPTIASIFMILFCVPLSIATARKVINLFRSFQ